MRPSAGKGFGVFATKLITRGTQIIVEEPLVSVAMPEMVAGKGFKMMDMLSDLETEFQALSPEQQALKERSLPRLERRPRQARRPARPIGEREPRGERARSHRQIGRAHV